MSYSIRKFLLLTIYGSLSPSLCHLVIRPEWWKAFYSQLAYCSWYFLPSFSAWSGSGVFLLPLGGTLVHHQLLPTYHILYHLYTWVVKGTVRVKCLAHEHITMISDRTRTRTFSTLTIRLLRLPLNSCILEFDVHVRQMCSSSSICINVINVSM